MKNEEQFVARLREYLSYDPETGIVTRTKNKYRAKAGTIAGHLDDDGYLQMSFDNKTIKLHRIIWALHYGTMPKREIDHINRIKTDNRISNLREVTRSQNVRNVSPRGATGVVGVFPEGKKYKSAISENGIRRHLGTFATVELASAAYQAAAATHYADRIEKGEV